MDGCHPLDPQTGTLPFRLIPTEPPSAPRTASTAACRQTGEMYLQFRLRLPTIALMFQRVLRVKVIRKVMKKQKPSIRRMYVPPRSRMTTPFLHYHLRVGRIINVPRVFIFRAPHPPQRSQRMSLILPNLQKTKNPRGLKSLTSLPRSSRPLMRPLLPQHCHRSGSP